MEAEGESVGGAAQGAWRGRRPGSPGPPDGARGGRPRPRRGGDRGHVVVGACDVLGYLGRQCRRAQVGVADDRSARGREAEGRPGLPPGPDGISGGAHAHARADACGQQVRGGGVGDVVADGGGGGDGGGAVGGGRGSGRGGRVRSVGRGAPHPPPTAEPDACHASGRPRRGPERRGQVHPSAHQPVVERHDADRPSVRASGRGSRAASACLHAWRTGRPSRAGAGSYRWPLRGVGEGAARGREGQRGESRQNSLPSGSARILQEIADWSIPGSVAPRARSRASSTAGSSPR